MSLCSVCAQSGRADRAVAVRKAQHTLKTKTQHYKRGTSANTAQGNPRQESLDLGRRDPKDKTPTAVLSLSRLRMIATF